MRKLLLLAALSPIFVGCQDDKGLSYVQTVQAARAGITALSLNQSDVIVRENDPSQTTQLTASIATATQSNVDYSANAVWHSSVPSVATVSATGLVTPVGIGDSVITASFAQYSDSVRVKVSDAALVSISFQPDAITVDECLGTSITAKGSYDDGTVRDINNLQWSSSATSIATVATVDEAKGTVLTHNSGTATITASRDTEMSASIDITVTESLASITLSDTALGLSVGNSSSITAVGSYNNGSSADITNASTWSIPAAAHTNYITLSNSYPNKGNITARSVGAAIVEVECGGTNATQNATVTVTEAVVLQSVSFDREDDPWLRNTDDAPDQLSLNASYSDGSSVDVTEDATWEILVGDSDFIFLSNDSGEKGEITFSNTIDEITSSKEITIRATYNDEEDQITIKVLAP